MDGGAHSHAGSDYIPDREDQGKTPISGIHRVSLLKTPKTGQPLSDAALLQLACIKRMAAALDDKDTEGMMIGLSLIKRQLSAKLSLPAIATNVTGSRAWNAMRNVQGNLCLTWCKEFTLDLLRNVVALYVLDSIRVERLYDLSVLDLDELFCDERRGRVNQSFFAHFSRLPKIEAPRFERHNELWLLEFDHSDA